MLQRCIRIKQLVNDGWRLQKIKEEIGDWSVDQERYQRRFGPSFERAQRDAAFWNLEEAVFDCLLVASRTFRS